MPYVLRLPDVFDHKTEEKYQRIFLVHMVRSIRGKGKIVLQFLTVEIHILFSWYFLFDNYNIFTQCKRVLTL